MQLLKDLTIVVLNKHFIKTITNYVTSYNIHFKYMFTYIGKIITFMMELHGCLSTLSPFLPINSSNLFISKKYTIFWLIQLLYIAHSLCKQWNLSNSIPVLIISCKVYLLQIIFTSNCSLQTFHLLILSSDVFVKSHSKLTHKILKITRRNTSGLKQDLKSASQCHQDSQLILHTTFYAICTGCIPHTRN